MDKIIQSLSARHEVGNRAVVYSAKIDASAVALIRFGASPTHYLQYIRR
ncbi:hypothetical protein [Moraxella lacunata]|nr:hypothetical protein [Moraxella lacunata]